FLVDPAASLVFGYAAVRVVREELREHDLVRKRTTDRERIADDRPLGLAEQAQNLTEVMNQTGQNEPARVSVAANRFRHLQEVLDLTETDVGVAIIHERVEELHRLPDAHAALAQGE